ncbi:hypothetical protein [Helicobacter ailurogastricus]|uniref:hypothetical protein n=1 Tax=Helicobacter ailurogastricus TaxID=1578720 RepID=UPI0013157484|nr:hypothetical protein [Helicobacter ailurogastricus]
MFPNGAEVAHNAEDLVGQASCTKEFIAQGTQVICDLLFASLITLASGLKAMGF